jgi:hypothetical protein
MYINIYVYIYIHTHIYVTFQTFIMKQLANKHVLDIICREMVANELKNYLLKHWYKMSGISQQQ